VPEPAADKRRSIVRFVLRAAAGKTLLEHEPTLGALAAAPTEESGTRPSAR